ncbi:mobilization protein MbpA [Wenyingzhuangia aestuarii]|uniref:mobilization protein MbpA n=1 Tax=Wenyingzhuangia aestuarii TaxID=1647582 RepID=UPI00143B9E78|nr:mobilization protein MbpA [Wenyingzhuangia aestuarii]NJB84127.1 hypothetical protein [Wenyingzhuangia aestuarii]
MKNYRIEIRVSLYERKLIKKNAKLCGLTVSEFCRRSVNNQKIIERFTDEQIELYKSLIQYHHHFQRIGNMFSKNNPNLSLEVRELANQFKEHLKGFN